MGSGLLGPQKTFSLALRGHVRAQGVLSTSLDSDPTVAASLTLQTCLTVNTAPRKVLCLSPPPQGSALKAGALIRTHGSCPQGTPVWGKERDIVNPEDYGIVDRSICTEADIRKDRGA